MSSVEIRSPDWEAVFAGLLVWAEEVVEDENVLGVLLYGSLARDEHAPGSDADLIVVVERSTVPPRERTDELPRPAIPIGCEILVYTEDELDRLLAADNPFLKRALREGRWLQRRGRFDSG